MERKEAPLENQTFSSKKERNFRYLQSLTLGGKNEIVLDCDIVLGEGEESEFPTGIMVLCDINGNGHTIDAKGKVPIFNLGWQRKDIVIKNLILTNGQSLQDHSRGGCINNGISSKTQVTILNCTFLKNSADQGGAIYNEGLLNIENCTFKLNHADQGGAIYNESYSSDGSQKISIKNSVFMNNFSKTSCDVIFNQVGEVNIYDCTFERNNAIGMIINLSGNLKIFNSKFYKNVYKNVFTSQKSALIVNNSFLTIENSIFKENKVAVMIYSEERSVSLSHVEFIKNQTEFIITNLGASCNIKNIKFKNNIIPIYGSQTNNIWPVIVYNETELVLEDIKVDCDEKTIVNTGNMLIKDKCCEIEKIIDNQGTLKYPEYDVTKKYFTFLDDLIHEENITSIKLQEDITLGIHEMDFYEGGIELDVDGLIIDGDGHRIDGCNLSRIFLITGTDITLKNIIFMNGHSFEDYEKSRNSGGGALRNYPNSNLKIENCEFINNLSEKHGGAIQNLGKVTLLNSKFTGNSIQPFEKGHNVFDQYHYGGAIYNGGKLTVDNTIFNNNVIKEIDDDFDCNGGAIFNIGDASISESILNENYAFQGGAIANKGKMRIIKSNLEKNNGGIGCAIQGFYGFLSIQDCLLKDNVSEYKPDSDAIEYYSDGNGHVEIINCKIE